MPSQDRSIQTARTVKEAMSLVDRLKLTILVEDSVSMEKPDLIAKHGLSFLVETRIADANSKILMDVGPPPDIAFQNADIVNADVRKVDAIVISHGHYDHAGALLEILKRIGQPTLVVTHPKAFDPKFACKPNLKFIGLEFDQSQVRAAGGRLLLARNPIKIANGVTTSGEVVRETSCEETEEFWTVEDEHFIKDPIIDDQALFIDLNDKGLVVITGCAHSGIINTVKHAQKITGINHVYAIIGGLHLAKTDEDTIQASINELLRINPKSIYPCHCTGSKAIHNLLNSFLDRCKPIQTGDVIEL
jgi:7,8-dihydropterin-6-yl-methyl-4-(beta-D-ribofuranosyl)aminobenzene 5'-phosphate synthase